MDKRLEMIPCDEKYLQILSNYFYCLFWTIDKYRMNNHFGSTIKLYMSSGTSIELACLCILHNHVRRSLRLLLIVYLERISETSLSIPRIQQKILIYSLSWLKSIRRELEGSVVRRHPDFTCAVYIRNVKKTPLRMPLYWDFPKSLKFENRGVYQVPLLE